MTKKKIIPISVALIFFIFFNLFFFQPKFYYVYFLVTAASCLFGLRQLSNKSLIDKKWWNFASLPVLSTASLYFYYTLLPLRYDLLLSSAIAFLSAAFIYLYYRSLYFYFILPASERRGSLENIAGYGNFFTFFFFASAIFGVQSFLNIPIWPLVFGVISITAVLMLQMAIIFKINIKRALALIAISSLVIAEIAWATFYLPFNFNVLGFTLAIDYYILIGLIKAYSFQGLNQKIVKLYFGLWFVCLFVVLLTARWL